MNQSLEPDDAQEKHYYSGTEDVERRIELNRSRPKPRNSFK